MAPCVDGPYPPQNLFSEFALSRRNTVESGLDRSPPSCQRVAEVRSGGLNLEGEGPRAPQIVPNHALTHVSDPAFTASQGRRHMVGHDARRLHGDTDGEGPPPDPQPSLHRSRRASVVCVRRQAKLVLDRIGVWGRKTRPHTETPTTLHLLASHAVMLAVWSILLQLTEPGHSRLHTAWRRRPRNRRPRYRRAGSSPPA